jgi:hypothetical protein
VNYYFDQIVKCCLIMFISLIISGSFTGMGRCADAVIPGVEKLNEQRWRL